MNDEFASKSALADEWEMSPAETPSPEDSAESVAVESEAEDWGMTNPLTPPPNQPNQPDASGWKQPEPVFRTSEGSAPKKFAVAAAPAAALPPDEKLTDFSTTPAPPLPPSDELETDENSAPPVSAAEPFEIEATSPPVSAVDVEPQPDISEQIVEIPPPIAAAPAVKQQSKALRIVSVAAGLLAMIGFVVGFLILIYYLFFKNAAAQ